MERSPQHNHDTLAVIGLGKVGLPIAAALASSGSKVVGYDPNLIRRRLLKYHNPTQDEILYENELSESLTIGADNLTAADTVAKVILNSAISFIIVPTPSLEDGSFSLAYIEDVCHDIGKALRDKTDSHLIVLVSTVSPGSVASTIIPILERVSGKTCGKGFNFCYSPALIALGDVISGFVQPDFAFVGEVDCAGADRLEELYTNLLPAGTPLHRMSAQSVEIAKIALNNFLTMKIGFSNLIGHLCDRTPNANAQDVLDALGEDKRIGKKFLKAGMGFGGPCLPRDNAALSASFTSVDIDPYFPDAILRSNEDHTLRLASLAGSHQRVAVLGLGYKSNTPVTLDSASITLCNTLVSRGYDVYAFDPLADKMDLRALRDEVILLSTLTEALDKAETVFLTVDQKAIGFSFENLPAARQLIDLSGGMEVGGSRKNIRTFGKGSG